MKRLIAITGLALMLTFSATAQEKETPSAEQKGNKSTQEKTVKAPKAGFVDVNGDGINDNTSNQKRKRGKQTDKFVDNDGDGINDNRCQGLGFGNKGQMKMYGKRGK